MSHTPFSTTSAWRHSILIQQIRRFSGRWEIGLAILIPLQIHSTGLSANPSATSIRLRALFTAQSESRYFRFGTRDTEIKPISENRLNANLTQKQIADSADLDIRTVQKIEAGELN